MRRLHRGKRRHVLAVALLAAVLSGSGCLRAFHPIRPTCPDGTVSPTCLPRCCRDHVHVFLIHGFDPLDLANLKGLRDHCHQLGFNNVHCGQVFHGAACADRIRRINATDPEARFVVLGFSAGANVARGMANELQVKDNIAVDLLVYIGGNTLANVPQSRPENAGKVVHILSKGDGWTGRPIDGAENVHYADVWHFGAPTHAETLQLLSRELAEIAERIPRVEHEPPPAENLAPTPRLVVRHTAHKPDEWDFLQPASQLRPVDGIWVVEQEVPLPATAAR